MKTLLLSLPTHWACALINGDETGLDEHDEAPFDAFVDWMLNEYGCCHAIDMRDDEPVFAKYHDALPFGVLACDCCDYVFDISHI